MAHVADPRGASEWDWVRETALDIGGSFTFARGVSAEQVISAFGMNPAHARLVPGARIEEALRYPDWRDTSPREHPWIRVGVAGEWGFAVDESSGGYGGYEEDAALELSAGRDAVLFTHTAGPDAFHYYVDGIEVTGFEPLLAWDRDGTDPDRFLPQMRLAGLEIDDQGDLEEDFRDPVIALLEMLTLALGIRLPREVAFGPLFTVQRD
jgi:hypothetical protein